jgi:hypothetical protein
VRTIEQKRKQVEATRRWRLKHPERAKESNRKCYIKRRDSGKKSEDLKKYRAIHLDRWRARDLLYKAVNRGKIQRPNMCSKCNVECVPEGHHVDHSKPLEVIWLCFNCHRKEGLK